MRRIYSVVRGWGQSIAGVWRQPGGLGKAIVGLALMAILSCPLAMLALIQISSGSMGDRLLSLPPVQRASPTKPAVEAAPPTTTRAPVPTFTPLPSATLAPTPEPSATVVGAWAQVLDVIDGDTIVVLQDGHQRVVSYMGIEAPSFGEEGQPDQVLASEARVANTVLVQGKVVRMEGKEGWVSDRGNLLRYVWLGDELVNAALVRLGYARCDPSLVGSPYLDTLARLEQEARQRQTGIWGQADRLAAIADRSPAPLSTAATSAIEVPAAPTPQADATPLPEGASSAPTPADAPTAAYLAMNLAPSPVGPTLPPDATEPPPPTQLPLPSATIRPSPTEPPPPPTEPPTQPPTPVPPPTAPPQAASGDASVQITHVFADGEKGRAEPDEYCEIKNTGGSEVNLHGWRLNAGAKGQDFGFPAVALAPGQSCRVYTNEQHPDSGGFSFESGTALWKNGGDCGYLYDAGGQQVHSYCY